jgi:hypothetical protein
MHHISKYVELPEKISEVNEYVLVADRPSPRLSVPESAALIGVRPELCYIRTSENLPSTHSCE